MNAKDDSRQKILQAAFEAFAANGFERTSMDDIVKRSGLSKGTLYWHFKNKRELFAAILQMVFQDMEEQLEALVEQDAPAADRIRIFFAQAARLLAENKNLIGFLINAFFQSSHYPEAQQVMMVSYERFIKSIEQIIQQGIERGEFREVDAHITAISLMAGGDGVAMYILLDPDWDMIAALNTLVDLILRGLQKEQSDS